MIIIKKFGGTSLGSYKRIYNVSKKIVIWKKKNKDKKLVVVVSAMSKFTDFLSSLSKKVKSNYREKSLLLSCGEQISSSLLSSLISHNGEKSISFQSWQLPILTENKSLFSYINFIRVEKIMNKLNENYIVVISGFQGLNRNNEISTLERGGSDTSAVLISKYLNSKLCYIYTDVEGVYQLDPNLSYSNVSKIINYKIILELSSNGAKVLALEAIRFCIKYAIKIIILSSFNKNYILKSGTFIEQNKKLMNYCTKQDIFLIKTKISQFKKLINRKDNEIYKIEIDLIKFNKNEIFFTIKENDYFLLKTFIKIIKVFKNLVKISYIGLKIRENGNFYKIINFVRKNFLKGLINSTEIKISFAVKKNKLKKCIDFFRINFVKKCD